MEKKGLIGVAQLGLSLTFIVFATALFVFYVMPIMAANFSAGRTSVVVQSGSSNELINISVGSNATTGHNVTNVTIEIPSTNWTFISNSNVTTVTPAANAFFSNTTRNASWWNTTTNGLVNITQFFAFNVSMSNGENTYNVTVFIIHSDGTSNSTNITITTNDSIAPAINNTTPVPSSGIKGLSSVLFKAQVTDHNLNLSTVTVISGATGSGRIGNVSLFYKQSVAPSYTEKVMNCFLGSPNWTCNTTVDLSSLLADGETLQYFFNATDASQVMGNNGTAASPLTVTADLTSPTMLDFVSTTPASGAFQSSNPTINVSINETNPDRCIFEWNNATAANFTSAVTGVNASAYCSFTFFTSTNFGVNVTVYVNDTAGNTNKTALRNFTIDSVLPLTVDYVTPTLANGSYVRRNYVEVNVTFNETNANRCLVEIGNATVGNFTGAITSAVENSYCFFNASVYTTGKWNYTVFINDSAGNSNQTIRRFITFDNVTPASIDFASPTPANGAFIASRVPIINVTFTETNPHNCIFSFSNGSVQNLTNNTILGNSCSLMLTAQPDLPINVTVYVNDSVGTMNTSALRNFTVDGVTPGKVDFISPTLGNGTYTSLNYLQVNATFNETNPHSCVVTVANASPANFSGTITGSGTSAYCFFNATSQTSGPWNVTVFVNDTNGVANTTNVRFVNVDVVDPILRVPVPAANSNITGTTNVTFSINMTEANIDASVNASVFYRRSGVGSYSSAILRCQTGPPQYLCNLSFDISSLVGNGQNLQYFFNTTDLSGRTAVNGTEASPLVVKIDTAVPASVDFVSPTPTASSFNRQNYAFINISVNDANPDRCIFEWSNGTAANFSTAPTGSGSATYCGFNFSTTTTTQPVNVSVYVNDTAGNTNKTNLRNFTLDNTNLASLTYVSPTLANGTFTALDYLDINVSFNEAFPHSCVVTVANASPTNFSGAISGTGSAAYCYFNASMYANGPWNFTVFINDTSGNTNTTPVRYVTVDNTTPAAVDFASPTTLASGFSSSATPIINITFTETNPHNCIFQFSNGSSQNLTNNTIVSGNSCALMLTTQLELPINVTVFINDSRGRMNQTNLRNFTVDTITPNLLTYVTPTLSNGSYTRFPYLDINVSFNETNPYNCIATVSNASASNITGTRTGSGSNAYCFANASVYTNGPWNFTLFINDSTGRINASVARFVTFDNITPAAVDFSGATPANGSSINGTVVIATTFTEINPHNCLFEWNNGSAVNFTNSSPVSGTCTATFVTSTIYLINVSTYINDSAGNANKTVLRSFTVQDADKPNKMDYVSPTLSNGTYTRNPHLDINVSFNETNPNTCLVEVTNGSAPANFTGAITGSGTGAYCFFNASTYANGPWNFTVFVNDTSGNANTTVRRFVTVDNTTAAVVDFVSPSPSASSYTSSNNALTFVASFSETNVHNCIFEFSNGTAVNYTNSTASSNSCLMVLRTTTDFAVNVSVYVNDSAGNQNKTALRNFTVDPVTPSQLTYVSPTVANGTGVNIPYIQINVSFNETNPTRCLVEFNNGTAVNYTGSLTVAGNNSYCFFNASVYTPGTANFTVFINDSTGSSNATPRRFVTFDNTTLGLVSWNYSFTTKTLNLTFNQTVDIRFVNVSSININITDNDTIVESSYAGVLNTSVPTVAGNGKVITIPVTDAYNGWVKTLDAQCGGAYVSSVGRLQLQPGFIRGMGGNNVTAASNVGYQSVSRWSLEVDTCASLTGNLATPLWHNTHKLSAITLTNVTSLGGNYTPQKVLESIQGNYTSVFIYNTSQGAWTSFVLGNTASTITTIGSVDQPYYIGMNVTDKIQIA